ncbi:thiamine ABC transporter substrate-binding protein [Jannaschia marina]|uniref:thiamine ABC transporter substrate-binding protein n=1 Tax=Jannaschia marina TaxID=2741674 RepID=UPI0015C90F3C|nr:thiamine ABC transporter substrate binding subunit [Jannaschia marina]
MKTTTIATGLTLIAAAASAEPLTVYAPDYFGSEWGPGPAIKAAFEAECECEIEYVIGDLLPRLRLEGDRTPADVVIGLNIDDAERARQIGIFAPHNVTFGELTMPVEWTDDVFLPYDWAYAAFIYDATKITEVPETFAAFLEMDDDIRIAVQDPRASASGLDLALWIHSVFGEEGATDAWAALAPRIATVTKGWSEAYGLFTEGEVDMVFSYATSPTYHIIAEGDDTKKAILFEEGHYVTVETAAQVAATDQPELAQAFMDFILTEGFQSIIPEGNWSMPANLPFEQLPEGFQTLPLPETALTYTAPEAEALRDTVVGQFEAGLRN